MAAMNDQPSLDQLEQLYFRTRDTLRKDRLRHAQERFGERLIVLFVAGVAGLFVLDSIKTADWPWWGEHLMLIAYVALLLIILAKISVAHERDQKRANEE
jgi:membrane protein implicated in regulation of membrane protease activity